MGACISKCWPCPHPHRNKESLFVQDKLVISQAPITPEIVLPKKQSISLLSSPSFSSDSCTSNGTSTSSCSISTLSSFSSSTCSSKDRSYSNEFLWACIKENPHIIPPDLDPVKEVNPVKLAAPKFPTRKLDSPSKSVVQPSKQSVQAGRNVLQPQKRTCNSSPSLARQRSFRKEFERTQTISSLPRRNFGSPSPSRRFNGDPCRGIPMNSPKRCNSPKTSCDQDIKLKNNVVKPISSSSRKDNLQHQSRSSLNKVSRDGSQLMRKRDTCTHHIQDGIDHNSIGAIMCNNDSNSLPIDDINNPLISLDCFIFL
ncbi:hypothetical protein NE237_018525 [Protea cynaroides]|uniref:Uncharacterized protein n=1 Tax=Protea cynaroides TaxID=273540 RepID=A0A9Q0KA87_9MAGN|nr:hypothetical protein NE237_018525 [Protea cynaroides]